MRGISQCVVKAVETDSVMVSVPVRRASISSSAASIPRKPSEIRV
jgi:hypothetical protein